MHRGSLCPCIRISFSCASGLPFHKSVPLHTTLFNEHRTCRQSRFKLGHDLV